MGSFAVEGPKMSEVLRQLTAIENILPMGLQETTIDGHTCWAICRGYFGMMTIEFIAPRESLAALWRKTLAAVRGLGGAPIGMAALNALRLEAGEPWFPADFNEGMIPHEAALESTHVSFNKGCYTGQEIVERVRSRGHVNRKRVSLKFSTSEPPPAGTKLRANGAELGFVTSAAFSPANGTAIGMGYVRREHFAPGSIVEFDSGTAEVK
jgi:folate-binding protein YgfZ